MIYSLEKENEILKKEISRLNVEVSNLEDKNYILISERDSKYNELQFLIDDLEKQRDIYRNASKSMNEAKDLYESTRKDLDKLKAKYLKEMSVFLDTLNYVKSM